MAPSHSLREKRPAAWRASPSAREAGPPSGFEYVASGREVIIVKGEKSWLALVAGGASPALAIIFCSSPLPTTASTSGIFFLISLRYPSTSQPPTLIFFPPPPRFPPHTLS